MENFWNQLANAVAPVVVAALPVLLGALFAVLVQYLRLLENRIKTEKPDVYNRLDWLAEKAVLVAEQMQLSGFIQDKKQFAMDYVQKYLDKYGIKSVTAEDISEAIERAVFESFNEER